MGFDKRVAPILIATVVLTTCQGTEAPQGLRQTAPSGGPVVVFDLFARPLPEVPLPNDIATRPDASSPTGRRLNASMIAPTGFERSVRQTLDSLDGWGTFAPISVKFEPVDQLLDMGNILRRHANDNFTFANDALYVIDIDPDSPGFGRPVPVDLGEGNFPWNLENPSDHFDNDPREDTTTLLFDTTYEDTNGNGELDLCEDTNHNGYADPGEDRDLDGEVFIAEPDINQNGVLDPEEDLNGNRRFDCSEDTDFDGHLDIPNLYCGDGADGSRIPAWECPDVVHTSPGGEVVIDAEEAWVTLWYEQETNTLIIQPLVPLAERTTYAVVLSNRLMDEAGRPVSSPFPAIHHVDQTEALRPLAGILSDHPDLYGDLTIEDVRFAWTFTTQSIIGDYRDVREGLYGRGPLSELADEFPTDITIDPLHGCPRNIECDLPENRYTIWARTTDGEQGLLDVVGRLLGQLDVGLGVDEDTVDMVIDPYDAVNYFALLRFRSPNFLDNDGASEDQDGDGRLDANEDLGNGILDPGEDLDGDGHLDDDEDVNHNGILDDDEDLDGDGRLDAEEDLGNGELDPGEDTDFDNHLDVDEDVNGNGILDGEEGIFDFDFSSGRFPHGSHTVTAFLAVPRADPERGIEPPFPVVLYNHGYGFLRIEALILAAYLARHGIATIGVDAVHHGLGGLEPVLVEMVTSIFETENLGPFGEALTTDRARDLNGDGVEDSGADYVTADIVRTRDLVRQTSIDLSQLIRIVRSFDGERLSSQDLDEDGELELAGDFDADGIVDIGGPDADFFVTGNSLGGIHSTVYAGLEPAIVATAPLSGGGQLSGVGLRSSLGSVQAAVTLPMVGPLIVTNPAERHFDFIGCGSDEDCPGTGTCRGGICRCESDRDCVGHSGSRCMQGTERMLPDGDVCAQRADTECAMDQISARFVVNNLNVDMGMEFACLDLDEIQPGDTLVARNLTNGEEDCFVAWPEGRSRLHIPSDRLDHVRLTIYEGEVLEEGLPCTIQEDSAVRLVIDEFEVDATFQQITWTAGDDLQIPARGFGLHRATPSTRRFASVAQILVDPSDPVNLARHHFLAPADFGDETQRACTLNVSTVGDEDVSISTGIAIARAAGIIDFHRLDPRLADASHPEGRTHNRYLIDHGVITGLYRLSPYRRASDGRQINFDADDFDRAASPPEPGWDGDGLDVPSTATPLRAWRAVIDGDVCTCIDASGEHDCTWPGDTVGPIEMVRCPGGVAALALPYFKTHGSHALLPEMEGDFNVYAFMANMIGHFFATRGTELRWNLCMESNTCTVEDDGFYTPPVIPMLDDGE